MQSSSGRRGILLERGRIIDPSSEVDIVGDLLLLDGNIAGFQAEGSGGSLLSGLAVSPDDLQILNVEGHIVAPGLVDMHVHLREPGEEEKETVKTGTAAAAAGGFTSIACMPNTEPAMDNQEVVSFVLDRARKAGLAKVYAVGALTKGRAGTELSEMWFMRQAGAVAFSDDGSPLLNSGLMWRALEYSSQLKSLLIAHAEDLDLSMGGVMHEGAVSTRLGVGGIPSASETVMTARDITILKETGGKLHIAHVSTKEALKLVEDAKSEGLNITCEVTPHHLVFNDRALESYDSDFKMKPPLRSEEDRQALINGLVSGVIDCIASDHAPHRPDEKEMEIDKTPFGVIGLETTLGACLTKLYHPGLLSLTDLIEKLSTTPAKILGIPGGTLLEGAPGDVTVFDPDIEWQVTPESFFSMSRNTPFKGMKLKGKTVHTIVGGELIYSDGRLCGGMEDRA